MPITKAHLIKIFLVFVIFFLFFCNAVGILEIGWISKPDIFISSNLQNLGNDNSVTQLEVFKSPEFFCLVIIGAILTFLLPMLNVMYASLLTFICMIPPFLMHYFAPQNYFFSASTQPLIPLEYTYLMILVLFVVNNLISLFVEMRHKRLMIESFSHFIPPQIAEQISQRPADINMSGEAREMTVMFTDLVNFTNISERLNPTQLTGLLNSYFTEMTEVLYRYDATIDKYMGDSIMTFWNAPVLQPDHANRAIAACLEMHERVAELTTQFEQRGWPAPSMSVGINTGLMNVGNMGSKYRIAYTVVGDSVNIASRIENLTRFYKVPSVVSESTMQSADQFIFRELDNVAVKGKQHKIRIFEPLCPKGKENDKLLKKIQNHDIALKYYLEKNWIEARKKFENLYFDTGDEYYQVMIKLIDDEYQIYLR